jgi:hypothetical protein
LSTSAQHLVASPTPLERRFYHRVVPSSLIYIAFGGRTWGAPGNTPWSASTNSAMLLNLSENGLLVSTPRGLTRNFVYRLTIPLNGLPSPLSLRVRVVWTNESRRAGIQMLDLSEHDREQIRKWAALESASDVHSEPSTVHSEPSAAQVPQRPTPKSTMALSSPVESPKKPPPATVFSSRPVPARSRSTSAKLALAILVALLVAALATAMFFGDRPLRKSLTEKSPFNKSMLTRVEPRQNRLAATPALAVPTSPVAQVYPEERGAFRPEAFSSPVLIRRENDRAARIDWHTASKPARVQAPENLDDAPPPTDLLAAAPSEIESLPAASFTVAPPPLPPRAPRIPRAPEPIGAGADTPKSRVLEVPTANTANKNAGVLNLPGERVFDSALVTTHVQRSILMPPAHIGSPFARREKVVVGELLSRVDPQPPHFQVRPGSSVTVRALIDKNGRVETLKPLSGPMTLVPNVARAVREWRYQPTLLDGKPVETEAYVLFEFHSPPTPRM